MTPALGDIFVAILTQTFSYHLIMCHVEAVFFIPHLATLALNSYKLKIRADRNL
jgi:hypothetical protein